MEGKKGKRRERERQRERQRDRETERQSRGGKKWGEGKDRSYLFKNEKERK